MRGGGSMWSSSRESEDGAGFGGVKKRKGANLSRFLVGMNWVDGVGTLERTTSFERKE